MALNDLTDQNIQDTYQKVVQTDGTNLADGTGSLLPISFDGNNVTISGSITANEYIVSSSVTNITIATLSGSTAFGDSIDDTHTFIGNITASGDISASGHLIGQIGTLSPGPESYDYASTGGDIVVDHLRGYNSGGTNRAGKIKISPGQIIIHPQNVSSNNSITNGLQFYGGEHGYDSGSNPYINTHLAGDLEIKVANNLIAKIEPSGIDVTGHITSSGNISASGTVITDSVIADTGSFHVLKGDTTAATGLEVSGYISATNITASGNISASGNIYSDEVYTNGTNLKLNGSANYQVISASKHLVYNSVSHQFQPGNFMSPTGNDIFMRIGGDTTIGGDLDASGNISSSGNVYGTGFYGVSSFRLHDAGGTSRHVITNGSDDLTITIGNPNFSSGVLIADAHLTASGNISSSGTITGNSIVGTIGTATQGTIDIHSLSGYVANEHLDWTTDVGTIHANNYTDTNTTYAVGELTPAGTISSSLQNLGNITASGNISSSGYIIANNYIDVKTSSAGYKMSGAKILYYQGTAYTLGRGPSDTVISGSTISLGNPGDSAHVTASGNISSSGNITGKIGYFSDNNGIYTDKIRRFSDSSTTTLIKLNDEHIKIFAGSNTAEAIGVQNQAVKISGSLNVESPTGGHITASGNISASGTITAGDGSGNEFTVRPNLYFFATNTGAVTMAQFGTGGTDNQGALPATNTTTVTLSQEQNSHASVFSLSSNRITISRAGLYKITYGALLEINNGSNRIEGFVGLVQETSGGDVSLVDGTEGRGYHRYVYSNRPSGQTYAASVIVNVAANSIYDLRFGMTKQSLASQKLRTMPTGTSFLIEAVT